MANPLETMPEELPILKDSDFWCGAFDGGDGKHCTVGWIYASIEPGENCYPNRQNLGLAVAVAAHFTDPDNPDLMTLDNFELPRIYNFNDDSFEYVDYINGEETLKDVRTWSADVEEAKAEKARWKEHSTVLAKCWNRGLAILGYVSDNPEANWDDLEIAKLEYYGRLYSEYGSPLAVG